MTIVESARPVTGGVDTHADVHVAAAVDGNGGVLGVESFATTPAGFRELHGWLAGFGELARVGVEGTGAYGAGLARYLRSQGRVVIEVDRPNRQERRRNGKSDELDAIEAARAALSGRASGIAKSADGDVEAIRALLVARRSARDVRIKYLNQIRHLGFTAPDELRERLRGVPREHLARTAASLRPAPTAATVMHATKLAIRTLGQRVLALETDSRHLDELIDELVKRTAPSLLEVYGVGTHTAAILLVAAGDNPHRLKSEAAFAHLCGVAPLPATTGKTQKRFRLNPGGNRQANHALWRIVFTRMSGDERTRKYVARRLAEGRSTREIMRSLKRYVARELYPYLVRD
ncbi:MAG: IS110 family transposase [Actinomycetota bacterium]|nr:IS110 family transposase [Actinomycetota bacterium]